MWNLERNDTNELTYKTEKDSQTSKMNLGLPGAGTVRDFGKVMYTLLYLKQITSKRLTVWHRELCSVLCGSLDGRGVWARMDTCICMAESLPCPPETISQHC